MNEENLRKIVKETLGDNNSQLYEPVYNIVKKIIDLPFGVETSISLLVDDKYLNNHKIMFRINENVNIVCNKIGIVLDRSKHDNEFIGLPFIIPFVKKQK